MRRRSLATSSLHRVTARVLVVLMAASLSACRTPSAPGQPPPGYASRGALTVALALGRVPLVDTEPAIPATVEAHRDLVFRQVDDVRDLALDLYRPKTPPASAPLIVFVHGGSWRGGERDDYRRYLVDYAAKGYVTASVSYRLAQEAHYPAAVDDVRSALAWLAARSGRYGFDPGRVALVGGSAGAHLAMLVAYSSPLESGTSAAGDRPDGRESGPALTIRGVVNFYGPADLTSEFARSHPTVQDFLGASYESAPDVFRRASPIVHVTPDDPPTLVLHGTLDEVVPIEQSDRLVARLEEAGVPHEYHRLAGWPHTMDAAIAVNEYAQYHMDRFFERYLIPELESLPASRPR